MFHQSMPVDGAMGSKCSTCSKCCMSVLKFSRSPCLDNHLSESIKTWTIDTRRVGFHSITSDPRVRVWGGLGGQHFNCLYQ